MVKKTNIAFVEETPEPPAVPAVEACGICRFYKPSTETCHRLPPQVVNLSQLSTRWPRLHETEWCGEFRVCES